MTIIEAIKARRSIRKFKKGDISKEILTDLIDCARLAPSGSNRQLWKFVVVTDDSLRQEIAKSARWGKFVNDASACIAIFCEKNSHLKLQDASAATENIMLAAMHYGLGSCWISSHQTEHSQTVESMLKCPSTHELVVLVAVGYPDENPIREKKSLNEVLTWNSF